MCGFGSFNVPRSVLRYQDLCADMADKTSQQEFLEMQLFKDEQRKAQAEFDAWRSGAAGALAQMEAEEAAEAKQKVAEALAEQERAKKAIEDALTAEEKAYKHTDTTLTGRTCPSIRTRRATTHNHLHIWPHRRAHSKRRDANLRPSEIELLHGYGVGRQSRLKMVTRHSR